MIKNYFKIHVLSREKLEVSEKGGFSLLKAPFFTFSEISINSNHDSRFIQLVKKAA